MTGPDLLVTGAALLAALAARRVAAAAADTSPSAARLRTVLSLASILLVLRLLVPLVPAALLTVALMLVAAWLPLAGLRFAEELARRHAPRPVKLAALGGALVFTGVAITFGLVWSTAALVALAMFQAAMLALMARHVWRSRVALGPGERRAVDTILLALLLTIPLAATDFTALFPDVPVRGGAFAVMVLVLATSGLGAGRDTPWRLAADVAVIAAGGGAVVLAAWSSSSSLAAAAAIPLAAAGAAITGLVLLGERLTNARIRRSGLLAALARTADGSTAAILPSHPLLEAGHVLGEAELAGYPPASILRLLDHLVVTADLGDAEAREAGRDLLDAAGATHLLRLSREPPRLLAVNAGAFASPALDDELALAARLIGRAA